MFKKLFSKLMKEETGFTLIELLVTIAILGVLFGIVTLTLSGVGSNAQATTCTAELGVVQSAVDVYMAVGNLSTLVAPDLVTNATVGSGGAAGWEAYLRSATSLGHYTVAASGAVSQDSCP